MTRRGTATARPDDDRPDDDRPDDDRADRLRRRGILELTAVGATEAVAVAAVDDLLARYGEAHRHYHDLEHLEEVLTRADALAHLATDPTAVRLALWWHDAVYRPAPDDEQASADLADRQLAWCGIDDRRRGRVVELVLVTAGHHPDPDDRDAAVVVDADLGILAGPPERYDRYVAGVRAERPDVDDDGWRAGRARVLQELLGRERLFLTGGFGADAEARARANLTGELSTLAR